MRFLGFAPRLAFAAAFVPAVRAAAVPVSVEGAAVTPETTPLPDVGEAIPNSNLIFLKPGADNERFKTWIQGLVADATTGEITIADIGATGGNDIAPTNTEGSVPDPVSTGAVTTSVAPVIEREINVEAADLSVISGNFDNALVELVKARPEVAGVVTHNDFEGRASFGVTTVSNTANANDDHGHGTHVGAIVAGATFGVAKKANLVAVKVCSANGKCTTLDILEGIFWAMSDAGSKPPGKYLANLSIGGSPDAAMDLAVQIAMDAGMPFAVAAGNNAVDACTVSPGRIPGAVTVAASGPQDLMANFSNFGACVDVVAPGVSILSASNAGDDAAATRSGTSMSSPFAAGVLALIAGQNSFTAQQLTNAVVQMATTDAVQNLTAGTPNVLLFNGGSPEANTASIIASTSGNGVSTATTDALTSAIATALTSTTDELTSTADALTSTADALTSTADALTSTADALTSTADALTSTADALTSTADALTSTADALTSTPDALTSTPDGLTSTDEALTSTADAPTSTPDALTSTPAALTSTADALTSTADALTSTADAPTSTTSTTNVATLNTDAPTSTTDVLTLTTDAPSSSTDAPTSTSDAPSSNTAGAFIQNVVLSEAESTTASQFSFRKILRYRRPIQFQT
ncbi:MAG: peptidase S8/S53 domain-containing protein [Olpidium bornovanus]|uniref:Peptidase S8/S53 domain-containing protein n=1 Tax=Olpidium bornovanus TaxID=278681 RepID=A0A8H7ZV30_9FUNG|nr:MAG: peptidase S8/S53 domain-containing protein [Olpidium bornovanus]